MFHTIMSFFDTNRVSLKYNIPDSKTVLQIFRRLTRLILHFQDKQEFGGLAVQAVPEVGLKDI